MLRVLRALGFLAPVAVALCASVVLALSTSATDRALLTLLVPVGLAAVAGMTSMALLAWGLGSWRLDRIASSLEATIEAGKPIAVRESGVPAERRLARALNAASGAFLQVEVRAAHDRLTGVANRETLFNTLVHEIERAARYAKPLSVAFIDIDRFKPINDTHGHNSGDAVLRQVAGLIAANIRSSDFLGRYGGEEFMLILPETAPEEAVELAEKLRSLVMQSPLKIAGGQTLRATVSIGVSGGHATELRLERLVEEADAAMYAAKSLGRNRTYLFRGVDDDAPVRRAPISQERRAAAAAIGQWASAAAAEALTSILAPQPDHRGRPSDMIAALATGLALRMGLPDDEIERVRIASLLHDLGKLAVPPEILDKPAALSAHEWQTVGEHPRIGQVILEKASSLREAIPIVLHHHERFNGGGYPHGLRGNEIPLGARIVAVADAYHAMVHDRPYQTALAHRQALDELRRSAGVQFDPAVVEAFCEVYAAEAPPDGLDEVYRLHQQARGPLHQLHPHAAELLSVDPAADHHAEVNGRNASGSQHSPERRSSSAGGTG